MASSFLSSIQDSGVYFSNSLTLIFKRPFLLIPIFITWILFVFLFLFFELTFNNLEVAFLYYFLFCICLSFSNFFLLEYIKSKESSKKVFFDSRINSILQNVILSLPLTLLLSVIWFTIIIAISLIEALTNSSSENKSEKSYSSRMRTISRGMAGVDNSSSSYNVLCNELIRVMRIYFFLLLTSISWEKKGNLSSFSRVNSIIKSFPSEFLKVYSVSLIFTILSGIVLTFIFYLDYLGLIPDTELMWTFIVIFQGFIWCFNFFLEQYSAAQLYLKYLKWEHGGKPKFGIHYYSDPDLFDNIYEFDEIEKNSLKKKTFNDYFE